jgi:hypothetical protein
MDIASLMIVARDQLGRPFFLLLVFQVYPGVETKYFSLEVVVPILQKNWKKIGGQ